MLRLGDLLAIIGSRSIFFLLLLGGDLIPVVDNNHVLVRQPQRARRHIIEDDARAVRPENGGRGLGERGHRLRLVARRIRAGAHEGARTRPRTVGAAAVENRGCGRALLTAVRGRLAVHRLAVQGDGHELGIGGQQDGGRIVAGGLQDRAGHVLLGEVAYLATGQHQLVTGLVVDDGLVTDRGDRRYSGRGEILDLRGLCTPSLAFSRERDQLGGPGRVCKDPPRVRHRDDPVAQVVRDCILAHERHGSRFVGITHPQQALVGVEDGQHGPALDLDRVLGQRDRLAQREGRGAHGGNRTAHCFPQRHVAAGLTDVEGRGLDRDRAVEHERVVVEVAQELTILVRHPNATVIDADLGDLDAAVDHGENAQHR